VTLVFHGHPLSSFCWKVLIALHENETPFEERLVNLGDPASRAEFAALWPIAKMPVLEDKARGEVVAETSTIIDYLDQYYPGPVRFVPADPERARLTRFWDRIHDLYIELPMQKMVLDRFRADDDHDATGVAEARKLMATALAMIDRDLAGKAWTIGDDFTLADCSALPALFYADRIEPLANTYPNAAALLERLKARPSVARVIAAAAPYFHMVPSG
jgi:glutathione S-transferase